MKYINSVNYFKTQLIFITATLTNELQFLLEKNMNLTHNTIIKADTTRNNVKYIVKTHTNADKMSDLKECLTEIMLHINENEKVIIYVTNIKLCKDIAEELNCKAYYSSLTKKENILQDFLTNNNQKILISTSALSMGVDAFNILYTIHIFKQYSITDFIQESDRVARNLKSDTSILFVNEKEYITKNIDLDVEVDFEYFKKLDYNVLCDFIHEKTCRRKIISKYYNNKIISQCDVNVQVLCDLCEKRHIELSKRKEKQLTSENVNYLQLENLKDKLISLQNLCIFCLITQEFNDMWSHTIYICIKKEKTKMITQLDTLQTMIQNNYMLKSDSCCYTCLLPQLLCNKNDHTCEFKNVVLEFNFVIAILVQSKRYQSSICTFETAKNVNQFAEFICKSITFHNTDSINAIKLIEEFNL